MQLYSFVPIYMSTPLICRYLYMVHRTDSIIFWHSKFVQFASMWIYLHTILTFFFFLLITLIKLFNSNYYKMYYFKFTNAVCNGGIASHKYHIFFLIQLFFIKLNIGITRTLNLVTRTFSHLGYFWSKY